MNIKKDRKRSYYSSYVLYFSIQYKDRRGRDRMVYLQLHVQSVPITAKVVSSNPAKGEVYSMQLYVIKFVSDLRQVCGFLHQ